MSIFKNVEEGQPKVQISEYLHNEDKPAGDAKPAEESKPAASEAK